LGKCDVAGEEKSCSAIAIKAVFAIVLALRRNIADKLVCGIRVFNLKGQTILDFGFWILDFGFWILDY